MKGCSVTNEWEDAVRRGSIDQLRRLVASGADVDARDGYGQTALMLAAREGYATLVEWLVDHGAALDHTAKYGLSALMLAVIGGHTARLRRSAFEREFRLRQASGARRAEFAAALREHAVLGAASQQTAHSPYLHITVGAEDDVRRGLADQP